MRAKEYLRQIRKIDKIITNKLAEVERWKSIAMGAGAYSEGDKVQSSGSQQKMADAVCRYIALEEELNSDIDRLVDTRRDIISTIERLNEMEYDLLHKIYVQGFTFQEVSVAIDRSYSWVISKHGRALNNLQKLLDERKKT